MALLGIVRLVALVLLVVFSSSLHQQAGVGAIRLHDQRKHAQQWTEERNRLRSYMTMDYHPWSRRVPKHN
ncbi:hypothetical protein HU200_032302 [Digitaria exilis]|uniref:Uncharacterized protein n=1 Tax=Digitaria exilis TaxID=1010633 RepID=A0A835ELW6_9POAL|nr:hypothetical protein HU200_032302 [Digitaria exilis]CAB3484897.1 unnamed protein product [Digitaria exilis]CAB3487419.1 unnamed protein product [Digitaria exilis]